MIEGDDPDSFGSPGGVLFDGLQVEQSYERSWIATDIDEAAPISNVSGEVHVRCKGET